MAYYYDAEIDKFCVIYIDEVLARFVSEVEAQKFINNNN